jgi:hypothetical protein
MDINNFMKGISPKIATNRPTLRSGILSLANIKGKVQFGHYIFDNDVEDMRNDWYTIGNDLKKALRCYAK